MMDESNKHAFFKVLLEYYAYRRCNTQIDAFLDGFYQVVPMNIINVLDVSDLQSILYGTQTIDINDWKAYTIYTGKSEDSEHQVIQWFWQVVEVMSQNELKKFLQFCTGCRSLPTEGFRGLKNNRKEE